MNSTKDHLLGLESTNYIGKLLKYRNLWLNYSGLNLFWNLLTYIQMALLLPREIDVSIDKIQVSSLPPGPIFLYNWLTHLTQIVSPDLVWDNNQSCATFWINWARSKNVNYIFTQPHFNIKKWVPSILTHNLWLTGYLTLKCSKVNGSEG